MKSFNFLVLLTMFSSIAYASELDFPYKKLSAPETDSNFTTFPNGKTFADFKVALVPGKGEVWTEVQQAEYEKMKQMPVEKVQWALMNLDSGEMLSESTPSKTRIFGASTSKMFVVSALLDKQNGEVKSYPPVVKIHKNRRGKVINSERHSDDDLDHMVRIYTRSSNTSWVLLQQRLGIEKDGQLNADLGRVGVIKFTERLGYHLSRAWQGDLLLDIQSMAINRLMPISFLRRRFKVNEDYIHGNELTAAETVRYLSDTYLSLYPGAEYAWKLLYTCQTGDKKGNKYIPNSIYVGGKTGTYPGGTGAALTEVNGIKKMVAVHNHALTFHYQGKQYGLVVLTDLGHPEFAAILTGGLIREFVGIR